MAASSFSTETPFELRVDFDCTLDFIVTPWVSRGFFATKAEAETEGTKIVSATRARFEVVDRTPKPRPVGDAGLSWDSSPDARDCAANASYWSGRAEAARAADAWRRETFAMKGKTVKVVKGRKVPVGTTGVCFWVGEGKSFNYGATRPWRVGFKDASGETFWTALSNVEVVETEVESGSESVESPLAALVA